MPVVRSPDNHGVEIFYVQQSSVIPEGFGRFSPRFPNIADPSIQHTLIHVAQANDLYVFLPHERGQIGEAHTIAADHPYS